MKKKLLVILFCFGIATFASAVEVINVDLNAFNDNVPYGGEGAYPTNGALYDDATSHWLTYYGGWGRAIGSPKTSNLPDSNEPNINAVFAAQLWIGDDGANHTYYNDEPNYPGEELLGDGFIRTAGEPNVDLFGHTARYHAFGGTFDIYVYGSRPGTFTLYQREVNGVEPNLPSGIINPADPNTFRATYATTSETKSVSGGMGALVENTNYVVFPAVDVNVIQRTFDYGDDGNDTANICTITDIENRQVFISYSNVINGLQLVQLDKAPTPISVLNTLIPAGLFNVAGDNHRLGADQDDYEGRWGFASSFGPDINPGSPDGNFPGPIVGALDRREFMGYDVIVAAENEGRYALTVIIDSGQWGDSNLTFYLDDVPVGIGQRAQNIGVGPTTPPVNVNLFEGSHTIKWLLAQDSNGTGGNIYDVNIVYLGPISDMNECEDVYAYGFGYAGDLNADCRVDNIDLDILTEQWLDCDDPNINNCL